MSDEMVRLLRENVRKLRADVARLRAERDEARAIARRMIPWKRQAEQETEDMATIASWSEPAQDDCICHETVVGKRACPVHGQHPAQEPRCAECKDLIRCSPWHCGLCGEDDGWMVPHDGPAPEWCPKRQEPRCAECESRIRPVPTGPFRCWRSGCLDPRGTPCTQDDGPAPEWCPKRKP